MTKTVNVGVPWNYEIAIVVPSALVPCLPKFPGPGMQELGKIELWTVLMGIWIILITRNLAV